MRWKCTDELPDALVHRPLAGALARALRRTPVTPNHLTLLSLGLGLCAGLYLAQGHRAAAALILAHLVLDCADGQLARLKGPSRWGRLLDGLSDDAAGVAMYVGLVAHGMPWPLAAAAGASLLLRGMVFDGLKALHQGAAPIPVYTRVQMRLVREGPVSPGLLRAAGLAGPSTHHVVLALAALSGRYEGFLVYALVLSNLIVLVLLWRRHELALDLAPKGQ